MGSEEFRVELKDGSKALIRPIRPADKDRLQRGLQLLSPRSRYLRFHAAVPRLSEAQLRYLTEIDYRDHMAWVALDADHPEEPGMAVARYVRLSDEPSVAEAAITVADPFHGRGLGTLLLKILARSAIANDIQTFRSYVLRENEPMLALFGQLGARIEPGRDGVWCVELDLPADTKEAAAALPGEVLRCVAKGQLPPMVVVDPPLWAGPGGDEPST